MEPSAEPRFSRIVTSARLLSINVGLPRDIEWRGKVVHTAIWKQPVAGRCRVRRLNLDGDGQGDLQGHGGEHRAVFVYQIESHRYWAERLGRSHLGPVRRELHRRGVARRRGVHRRSLRGRQRAVRSHAAARHLLPGRDSYERAAHGGAADGQREARLLPACVARGRGRRRRCHRQGGRGARAHEHHRDQRAIVRVAASARAARARAAPPGAARGLACVVRGAAAERRRRRQRGPGAGVCRSPDDAGIPLAGGDADRARERRRDLAVARAYRWAAAGPVAAGAVRGAAAAPCGGSAAAPQLLALGAAVDDALPHQCQGRAARRGRDLPEAAGARRRSHRG